MLTLVLADAELELVPEEIARHPSVVKNAQKRGKRPELTLLDSSLHHQALRKIVDGGRRGRPDIAHFFLLLALDSIANSRQEMRVFVHTRNDDVITIDPETRIPRSSNRFFGLVESLFLNGAVPDKNKPLMYVEKLSLEKLLSRLDGEKICLHPQGEEMALESLFKDANDEKSRGLVFVIGGFSEGDYKSPVKKHVDSTVSIYPGVLKVWTVASEIIAGYERAMGLV